MIHTSPNADLAAAQAFRDALITDSPMHRMMGAWIEAAKHETHIQPDREEWLYAAEEFAECAQQVAREFHDAANSDGN